MSKADDRADAAWEAAKVVPELSEEELMMVAIHDRAAKQWEQAELRMDWEMDQLLGTNQPMKSDPTIPPGVQVNFKKEDE